MQDDICKQCGRIHEILRLPETERLRLGSDILKFLNYARIKNFHLYIEADRLLLDAQGVLQPAGLTFTRASASAVIDEVMDYIGICEQMLPSEVACLAADLGSGGQG